MLLHLAFSFHQIYTFPCSVSLTAKVRLEDGLAPTAPAGHGMA
jgi:hypothetical protein